MKYVTRLNSVLGMKNASKGIIRTNGKTWTVNQRSVVKNVVLSEFNNSL